MTNEIKNLYNDAFLTYRLRRIDNPGRLEKKYVYDNQLEAAKKIIFNFFIEKRWSLLLAEMQSGKSGVFFSIPYIINENRTLVKKLNIDVFDNIINVWLLTGMMDTELTNQFKGDIESYTGMGIEIRDNVLHNNSLQNYINNNNSNKLSYDEERNIQRMRKNSLILIDESHYGSDKKSSLDKFLKEIVNISPNGEKKFLEENNIYVVSISATPMAESLKTFKKELIILQNSPSYYGISEMFRKNKIHNSYDLKDSKSINNMLDFIDNLDKIGFIIIRTNQKGIDNILIEINKRKTDIDLNPIYYDSRNKDTIDSILSRDINKKTIIFIKGKLRAGKQLNNKSKVIMVHDTADSKVDVTVQSLLGRFCGHDSNKDTEIFCDKTSAEKYRKWVESGYDLSKVPDKSKNIKAGRKNTKNKNIDIKFIKSIEFDVNNINYINTILNSSKSATKPQKNKILRLLNSNEINNELKYNIVLHTFNRVEGEKDDAYGYQYLDPKNNKVWSRVNKPNINDIGKPIISATYDKINKKLLILIGEVVEKDDSTLTVSDNCMYHETNTLELAEIDLD